MAISKLSNINSLLILGRLVIFLLASIFIYNTAHAEGIGFGYLRKDGVISDVIYFKNNQWMQEVNDINYKLPLPHAIIISRWIRAQNDQEDVDCSNKGLDKQYLHDYYYYLCHFPKKLSETTAAELAELLKKIKPNGKTNFKGDHRALFTQALLEGMRLWTKSVEYGNGRKISFENYTKIFWSEPADKLNTWYRVNTADIVSIEPEFAYIDEGMGDHYCDGVVIKTKTTSMMTNQEGWVSTRNKDYRFNRLKQIARVRNPDNVDPADTRFIAIPKEYEDLFKKIKGLWGNKEKDFLTQEQASHPFYHVNILSSEPFFSEPLRENRRLVYFSAKKYLHQGNGLAIYRGWAILSKGADIKWMNLHAEKMLPDYDESLYPFATITMNNRMFILAGVETSTEKGGSAENEILEFANDTIVQPDGISVRYHGGCPQ